MTVRAVLFDLDDTLYEERQYFSSGFTAVGIELARRGAGEAEHAQRLLEQFHHVEGRENVLQKLSSRLPFPAEWIPALADVFRLHTPAICLAEDAREVLPLLRSDYKLGCVTDGWASVQRAKLAALSVGPLLDVVVIADDYGRARWKPDPFPFVKCCELLGVKIAEAVFVGDNPERDILGAYNAEIRPIRLRRPDAYFGLAKAAAGRAEAVADITSLLELPQLLATL